MPVGCSGRSSSLAGGPHSVYRGMPGDSGVLPEELGPAVPRRCSSEPSSQKSYKLIFPNANHNLLEEECNVTLFLKARMRERDASVPNPSARSLAYSGCAADMQFMLHCTSRKFKHSFPLWQHEGWTVAWRSPLQVRLFQRRCSP